MYVSLLLLLCLQSKLTLLYFLQLVTIRTNIVYFYHWLFTSIALKTSYMLSLFLQDLCTKLLIVLFTIRVNPSPFFSNLNFFQKMYFSINIVFIGIVSLLCFVRKNYFHFF